MESWLHGPKGAGLCEVGSWELCPLVPGLRTSQGGSNVPPSLWSQELPHSLLSRPQSVLLRSLDQSHSNPDLWFQLK